MKYLKIFNNYTEFYTFESGEDFIRPNISMLQDNGNGNVVLCLKVI